MDEIAVMLIERQCVRLMTLYNIHLDNLDADAFTGLFTDDVVWSRAGQEPRIELVGHAAMRDFLDLRIRRSDRLRQHLLANPVITVESADSARGLCTGLVIHGPAGDRTLPVAMGGVELVGHYRDTYRRTPQGWRIATRELTRVIDLDIG